MGDRAGFVARPKKGISAIELMMQIFDKGGFNLSAITDLGIVIGLIKADRPEGCWVKLMECDKIDTFVSLSEISNAPNNDYCSFGKTEASLFGLPIIEADTLTGSDLFDKIAHAFNQANGKNTDKEDEE